MNVVTRTDGYLHVPRPTVHVGKSVSACAFTSVCLRGCV